MKAVKDRDTKMVALFPDDEAKELIESNPKRYSYVSKSTYKRAVKIHKESNKPYKLIQQTKYKKKMAQQEINKLLEKVALLQMENENLKKEQEEFMNQLLIEVQEIEKTNSFWKYFKYIQLVVEMIATIREFAQRVK